MTFRPSAPNKKRRWAALLAVVVLGTGMIGVGTALAAPSFAFTNDDAGANDEPGQKDLTADATAIDPVNQDYYTAWKWDDTSWSGNNTGDACSLFDTDGDGKANVAVCVTIGKPAAETSTRVYSCTDNRSDRCTGATLVGTEGASTSDWCSVAPASAAFPPPPTGGDTQATCNITLVDSEVTAVSGLNNGTFLNSCSYPSQEPNSDPSDCVHRIASVDVTVSTTSSGTITWTATLSDTATLSPNTATGQVVFKLYSDSTCSTLIWTSDADTSAPFGSGTTGGSPALGNVITNTSVNSDGKYYWIADYTSNSAAFNNDSSACGELVTIVSTVTGSSGS